MAVITLEQLSKAAGVKPNDNMRSVQIALDKYGPALGLDRPHRLAQFLAQVMHESGDFRFDREIWGPTAAQKRYDTRTDLGNTPAVDGDGKKNAGRGPIQLTGGANIAAFEEWCRQQGYNPPDFTANPDLINTDPWEGLSAIWYWAVGNPTHKSLNRYADENNIEMVTRKINGGLNGYSDRLENYDDIALVLLDYGRDDIAGFQRDAKKSGLYTGELDGESGPKTRAALHLSLVHLDGTRSSNSSSITAAPVVEEKTVVEERPVAVAPEGAEKRGGLWTAAMAGLGSVVASIWGAIADMPIGVKIAIGLVTLGAIGFMLFKGELIVRRVKSIVKEIEA